MNAESKKAKKCFISSSLCRDVGYTVYMMRKCIAPPDDICRNNKAVANWFFLNHVQIRPQVLRLSNANFNIFFLT
jgi:hypothetical protein